MSCNLGSSVLPQKQNKNLHFLHFDNLIRALFCDQLISIFSRKRKGKETKVFSVYISCNGFHRQNDTSNSISQPLRADEGLR